MKRKMKRNKDIIVFVSDMCSGCNIVKKKLKKVPNIRFVDIFSKEADNFLTDEEIVVPSAYRDGSFCRIGMDGNNVYLDCHGEKILIEDRKEEGKGGG